MPTDSAMGDVEIQLEASGRTGRARADICSRIFDRYKEIVAIPVRSFSGR